MDGFYSFWSKPFFSRNNFADKYFMYDYEILTLLLSAAVYQKYNGKCSVYLDECVYDYFFNLDILDVFEGDICDLKVDKNIDSNVFWAAGKIFALSYQKNPFVMIDNDLIIWKNITEIIQNKSIVGIHREHINDEIYPDPLKFNVRSEYLPKLLDLINTCEDVLPLNTAFLYSNNREVIDKFTHESIEFMINCREVYDYLRPMVFAEQRLLPIIAQKKGIKIDSCFEFPENIGKQQMFTHLWGHKDILKYNLKERQIYNLKVLNRLKDVDEKVYDKAINAIKNNF